MHFDIFHFIDLAGVIVFAFVGAMKGVERRLDILGITVTGVATALGGGMLRDVLVGRVPVAITNFADVLTALAGVAIACAVIVKTRRDYATRSLVLVMDALGLAAFTSTGAMLAREAELSIWGVLLLATLTGCGGGAIADLLCNQVPGILREDFYAICCLGGALGFYILQWLGYSMETSTLVCHILVLLLRLPAIFYGWHLPRLPYLRTRKR